MMFAAAILSLICFKLGVRGGHYAAA